MGRSIAGGLSRVTGDRSDIRIGLLSPEAIFGASATGVWDDRSATFTGATWTNRAGGTNFTQATAGNQPVSGTAINSRPTLQMDGTDDWMDAGAISGLMTASAFCVWVVARPLGTLAAGPAVGTSEKLFVTDSGGYFAATVATDARGVSFDTVYRITSSPGTMVSGTVYQARLRLDGGTLSYRLRNSGGVVGEGTSASGTLGSLAGVLRIGRSYLSQYQQADIAAVYVVNVAPTAAQLSSMDRWTSVRYGV